MIYRFIFWLAGRLLLLALKVKPLRDDEEHGIVVKAVGLGKSELHKWHQERGWKGLEE